MSERSNNAAVRRRRNRKDKEREKREREAKRRNPISREEREKRAEMTPAQRRKYLEVQAERRRTRNQREAEKRRQNASPGEEYVGPGDNPVVGDPPGSGTGNTRDKNKNKKDKDRAVKRKKGGKGTARKNGGGAMGPGGMPTPGGIRSQVYNMPVIQGIMADRAARREAMGGGGGFPSIVGAMFGGPAPTRPNTPSRAGQWGASTGEHSVSSTSGRGRSGNIAEDFARGRISRDEFERQMGTSGRPVPQPGGGRSRWPNPLTTPGHQQTSRARPPSPGGNFPPRGQTGRARPPSSGASAQRQGFPIGGFPRQGQTGRARPPSDGGSSQRGGYTRGTYNDIFGGGSSTQRTSSPSRNSGSYDDIRRRTSTGGTSRVKNPWSS